MVEICIQRGLCTVPHPSKPMACSLHEIAGGRWCHRSVCLILTIEVYGCTSLHLLLLKSSMSILRSLLGMCYTCRKRVWWQTEISVPDIWKERKKKSRRRRRIRRRSHKRHNCHFSFFQEKNVKMSSPHFLLWVLDREADISLKRKWVSGWQREIECEGWVTVWPDG